MPRGNYSRIKAGGALFELSLSSSPLEKGLARIEGRILHFGQTATGSFARATRGLAQFGNALTRIGSLGILGGRGLGGLTGAFAGAGASAALFYPIKLAANIEQASAALSVFTGSMASARSVIGDLETFSAKAVLPLEELVQQMRLLMTRDIPLQDAMTDIKALAELAAGNTDEFYSLVKAFSDVAQYGRLAGEEMRQFKNTALNPLKIIADETGKSLDELKDIMTAGGIPFSVVEKALRSAVAEGGRFHGLLEQISKTATGQFRQALVNIKKALRPLGENVLPPITKMLQQFNKSAPLIGQLLKQYAALYQSLLVAVIGAGLFGTALVALGITIASIAAITGAFVSVVTGLVSLLGFLLFTKLGVVITALGALAAVFVTATSSGKEMVRTLTSGFRTLGGVVKSTIDGMSDALSAGSPVLASRVMFAGMRVAWAEGTMALRKTWGDLMNDMADMWGAFKNLVVSEMSKIMSAIELTAGHFKMDAKLIGADIQEMLGVGLVQGVGGPIRFAQKVAAVWKNAWDRNADRTLFDIIGGDETPGLVEADVRLQRRFAEIERRGREALANVHEAAAEVRKTAIDKQVADLKSAIALAKGVDEALVERLSIEMQERENAATARRLDAEHDLIAARREFQSLLDTARLARTGVDIFGFLKSHIPAPLRDFYNAMQKAGISLDQGGGGQATKGIATFDTRLLHQMVGSGSEVERKQLKELQEIRKNTAVGPFSPFVWLLNAIP